MDFADTVFLYSIGAERKVHCWSRDERLFVYSPVTRLSSRVAV